MFPQTAPCADVTLTWKANQEADLAGYNLYFGTTSGNYSDRIDLGNITRYTLTGLQDSVTYYLAVTAYNFEGDESDYSAELSYTPSAQNAAYRITAKADNHGSISPAGEITVEQGSDKTF